MTDEERALEWFRNRRTAVTMKGAREMYDIAIRVLQERVKRPADISPKSPQSCKR